MTGKKKDPETFKKEIKGNAPGENRTVNTYIYLANN